MMVDPESKFGFIGDGAGILHLYDFNAVSYVLEWSLILLLDSSEDEGYCESRYQISH